MVADKAIDDAQNKPSHCVDANAQKPGQHLVTSLPNFFRSALGPDSLSYPPILLLSGWPLSCRLPAPKGTKMAAKKEAKRNWKMDPLASMIPPLLTFLLKAICAMAHTKPTPNPMAVAAPVSVTAEKAIPPWIREGYAEAGENKLMDGQFAVVEGRGCHYP